MYPRCVRGSYVEARISHVDREVKVRIEPQRAQERQVAGPGRMADLNVVHRIERQRASHYLIGAFVHKPHRRPGLDSQHIRRLGQILQPVRFGQDLDTHSPRRAKLGISTLFAMDFTIEMVLSDSGLSRIAIDIDICSTESSLMCGSSL